MRHLTNASSKRPVQADSGHSGFGPQCQLSPKKGIQTHAPPSSHQTRSIRRVFSSCSSASTSIQICSGAGVDSAIPKDQSTRSMWLPRRIRLLSPARLSRESKKRSKSRASSSNHSPKLTACNASMLLLAFHWSILPPVVAQAFAVAQSNCSTCPSARPSAASTSRCSIKWRRALAIPYTQPAKV